jgi:hypothetical protein
MSLDVWLEEIKPCEVFQANITHNLTAMSEEAGIYKHLWRPEEIGIKTAHQLIAPLQEGLTKLLLEPERFKKFDPPNKWGSYESLVKFVSDYLAACTASPSAAVKVSR